MGVFLAGRFWPILWFGVDKLERHNITESIDHAKAIIALLHDTVLRNPFKETRGLQPLYHTYVWTLCAGTTIAMIATNDYEPSGDGKSNFKQRKCDCE